MPLEAPRIRLLSDPVVKERLELDASDVLNTISRLNVCVPGSRVNCPGYRETTEEAPALAAVVKVMPQGPTAFPIVFPPEFEYCILDENALNVPLAVLALLPQKSS